MLSRKQFPKKTQALSVPQIHTGRSWTKGMGGGGFVTSKAHTESQGIKTTWVIKSKV